MPPRPRGRPPKKDSRMAAAVENMAVMGFEESLVKSTVQELLKLYTKDGWFLIEEHSYSVLLNTLLEKTASPPQEKEQEPALLQQQEGDGDGGIVVAESSVGSSSMTATANQENGNTKAAAAEETDQGDQAPSSSPAPPPQRKRKPYYGWITNSKDEGAAERELIELPPMPPDVFEAMWNLLPSESDSDPDQP